jgi:FMN phosphatase YigB (HAD superfamily)
MRDIKKLAAFDFDGTLCQSPSPETGKGFWEEKTGKEYPHIGWWSKPESLDINVFDIQLYGSIETILRQELTNPDVFVIILTSRLRKLQPQIESILKKHDISVDEINMSDNKLSKGEKILQYLDKFPNLLQIDVYDDNYEKDITSFKAVRNQIPKKINFNIYHVKEGEKKLINENYLTEIIFDELLKIAR